MSQAATVDLQRKEVWLYSNILSTCLLVPILLLAACGSSSVAGRCGKKASFDARIRSWQIPLMLFGMIVALASPVAATTWHVPDDAPTIQAAIDSCGTGDIVHFEVVELLSEECNISFRGKAITVQGDGLIVPGMFAFCFEDNEGPDSRLIGVTIHSSFCGVLCDNASPTIWGCTISSTIYGLYCDDASPSITACTFISGGEGGIFSGYSVISDARPTVHDCAFYPDQGADGIVVGTDITATDCVFSGGNGGIVFNWDSEGHSALVNDCLFTNTSDYGIKTRNTYLPVFEELDIRGSVFADNAGVGIRCHGSGPGITGCSFYGNAGGDIVGCGYGACCGADGSCTLLQESDCVTTGGDWLPYEYCNPNPCVFACCRGNTCQVMTGEECGALGGEWHSGDVSCDPNPCPMPHEAACCISDECFILSEGECLAAGGRWHPEWVECLPGLCNPAGPPCPPAWIDEYDETTAVFLFEVPGVLDRRPIIASGSSRVLRHPAEYNRAEGGCQIETEVVELELEGIYDPAGGIRGRESVSVRVSLDTLATYGTILSSDDGAGNPAFPDTSWFHLNTLITLDDGTVYPHTVEVGNLLATSDLWNDLPCVDPEGPYLSSSGDYAHIPCYGELAEGACALDDGIGGGCLVTSEMICELLSGSYLGDDTDCQVVQVVEASNSGSSTPLLNILQNPSSAQVTIRFWFPKAGQAKLEVFDSAGRRVRSLVNEWVAAGTHTALLDGSNSGDRALPSGIYYVRLVGDHGQLAKKAVLVR